TDGAGAFDALVQRTQWVVRCILGDGQVLPTGSRCGFGLARPFCSGRRFGTCRLLALLFLTSQLLAALGFALLPLDFDAFLPFALQLLFALLRGSLLLFDARLLCLSLLLGALVGQLGLFQALLFD